MTIVIRPSSQASARFPDLCDLVVNGKTQGVFSRKACRAARWMLIRVCK